MGPPVMLCREVFQRALQKAFECYHKPLNKMLLEHEESYRKCGPKETCVSVTRYKAKVYTYQVVSRWGTTRFESTILKPPANSYRPGTLVEHVKEKTKEAHDNSVCENRLIVRRAEDLLRLTERLGVDEKGWRKGGDNLVPILCAFFVRKGLMYNYLVGGAD